MKPIELRIGNYVSNQTGGLKDIPIGEPHQIEIIDFPWAELYVPILLTEQWLKDFGFEQDCNWFNKWGENFRFKMCMNDKSVWTEIYYDGHYTHIEVDIKYVHQLQNLYFALTNKELIDG